MNSKIFLVSIVLLVIMSSLAFAQVKFPVVIQDNMYVCCEGVFGPQVPDCGVCFRNGWSCHQCIWPGYYYYQDGGDDDDGPSNKKFEVEVDSSCDENLVLVEDGSDPVNGAKVTVQDVSNGPIASGNTDSNGEFTFSGCDMKVSVYVNKKGYSPKTVTETLVSCASCEEDEEPEPTPEPEPEPTPEPEPETGTPEGPECTVDADCASSHYCTTGGDCMPVSGCGDVVNHTLVPYECGDDESCPECQDGYTCVDNLCKLNEVEGEDGFVGDNKTIKVTLGGEPCKNCDVEITGPDGKKYTGKTDENGQFVLPLSLEGSYKVALMDENGDVDAETTVKSLPKPAPVEPDKPTDTSDDGFSLIFLLILLALLLGGVMYWRGKGKKK